MAAADLCELVNNNCLFWFRVIYYVSISASENRFFCLSDRISHVGNVFAGVFCTPVWWKHHQMFDKYEAIITAPDYTYTFIMHVYECMDRWGAIWRSGSWSPGWGGKLAFIWNNLIVPPPPQKLVASVGECWNYSWPLNWALCLSSRCSQDQYSAYISSSN